MNKERVGFLKEMTFPKVAALFVVSIILAGMSIKVATKALAMV